MKLWKKKWQIFLTKNCHKFLGSWSYVEFWILWSCDRESDRSLSQKKLSQIPCELILLRVRDFIKLWWKKWQSYVTKRCRKFLGSWSYSEDKEFWISWSCDGKRDRALSQKTLANSLGADPTLSSGFYEVIMEKVTELRHKFLRSLSY